MSAGDYMHLLTSSSVFSGVRMVNGQPSLTGSGASLSISTPGELRLSGAVTAGGALSIAAGESQFTSASYFDSILDRKIESVNTPGVGAALTTAGDITTAISGLNSSSLSAAQSRRHRRVWCPFSAISTAAA